MLTLIHRDLVLITTSQHRLLSSEKEDEILGKTGCGIQIQNVPFENKNVNSCGISQNHLLSPIIALGSLTDPTRKCTGVNIAYTFVNATTFELYLYFGSTGKLT